MQDASKDIDMYLNYANTVKRFLISLTGNFDLSEDLTQETFYQAYRSIHRFHGDCKLSVWLCQIAKHVYFDHLKKEKHIRTCEKCRQKIGYMADPINCPEISEDAEVKEPFLKIKKRNRIHVIAAVAITICILGSAMFAVQEVGVIHNYFYPRSEATIINETGRSEWLTVNISGKKYLNFSSVFYNKELINDANSSEKVAIMIYDEEGRVVMDSITIEPGETINLDMLKNDQNYIVKAKCGKGTVFLNFF